MCARAFILYGYTYIGGGCIPCCWFSDVDADCGDRNEENNCQAAIPSLYSVACLSHVIQKLILTTQFYLLCPKDRIQYMKPRIYSNVGELENNVLRMSKLNIKFKLCQIWFWF